MRAHRINEPLTVPNRNAAFRPERASELAVEAFRFLLVEQRSIEL
jgi:hypothetical protein